MTRTEITNLIFPAIFKTSSASPESISSYLETISDRELNEMLEKQIKAGLVQRPAAPSVTQEQVERTRQQAEQELAELQQAAADRLADAEADRRQAWLEHRAKIAQASEGQDRTTFEIAAHSLRFGNNFANWSLTRATLGLNFTVADIQQAIAAGRLQLSAPSHAELLQEEAQTRQQLLDTAEDYLEPRGPESFQIRNWIKTGPIGEVKPRVELIAKIANAHSRDPQANQLRFRGLFLSVTNIGQLQSMAEQIEQRQQFRNMTKQQLREYIRNQNQGELQ